MNFNKNITVGYHSIEAADDEYFTRFKNAMGTILDGGEPTGAFDSGENHYLWKINEAIDTDIYFITLVKERGAWPVWFNDNGSIANVPLSDGSLGDLFYGFVNSKSKFMLCFAAGGGSASMAFKKFLNEFSLEGGVKITPLLENNVNEITMAWDYYKKISFSVNFPTYDDLAEFKTTREGGLMGIIDELCGLKADISIKAPRNKQVLNAYQVRDITKELLSNDFCTNIKLRGADFETQAVEEYDLKNAQIKYSEYVEISGNFMSETEAIGILRRAYNDQNNNLLQK